ncbi:MAG: hypothetical protein ABR526_02395 [Chthoniobacterales bacterium]
MKSGTFIHSLAIVITSAAAVFSSASAADAPSGPVVYAPSARTLNQPTPTTRKFEWKKGIVTTVFWIGEKPSGNNPTPNKSSSWDADWTRNYGGFDDPDPARRRNMLPVSFTPRQNPFYCALPYNDKARTGHRPEAPNVVPWFREAYQGPAVSTCKGRWIAIHKGSKTVYAQWEDAGPFRTDHWQYVFGNERPKPNLNQGAGLDVSPAVRDYLGLQETDVTDWKFVEFKEVPPGPWAKLGDNNTFVINQRNGVSSVAQGRKAFGDGSPR